MQINNFNSNRFTLDLLCSDAWLPEICTNNTRLTELFRTTLEKRAHTISPSDFKNYAELVSKTFTKDVIDSKGLIIEVAGRTFLVRLKPGKVNPQGLEKKPQIFVIDLHTMQLLGRGIYFSALAVHEVISGNRMVFKSVTPHTDHLSFKSSALNEVRHSKRLLKKLNPFGITSGIQKKPLATIGLTNPSSTNQVLPLLPLVGTLEIAYDSELFDRIIAIAEIRTPLDESLAERVKNTSRKERLLIGKQLLQGLAALHEAGFSHGDLKLENALILGQGQSIIVHISDFGNARHLDLSYPPKTASGTLSMEYNLKSDLEIEEHLFRAKDWELLHLYNLKRDLFQMGVLLAKSLNACDPFITPPRQFINLNNSCLEMTVRDFWPTPLSDHLLNLLHLMVNPNPLLRPTAKEALRRYMELISQSNKLKRLSV